jgi:hypothetical protein
VQREPFTGVEAQAQRPPLPGQGAVVVQVEAHAVRLGDLDRPQAGAQRAGDRGVVEVAGRRGNGHRAEVVDGDHLAGQHVDEGHQAVDRVRPRVVAGVLLDEGQAAQQAAARLVRVVEDAGRQGGHADDGVGQPASGQRGPPPLVLGDELLDELELLLEDGRLPLDGRVDHAGRQHLGRVQADDDVAHRTGLAVEQQDAHPPRRHGLDRELLVGRLVEAHVGDPRTRRQQIGGRAHLPRPVDLRRAQHHRPARRLHSPSSSSVCRRP